MRDILVFERFSCILSSAHINSLLPLSSLCCSFAHCCFLFTVQQTSCQACTDDRGGVPGAAAAGQGPSCPAAGASCSKTLSTAATAAAAAVAQRPASTTARCVQCNAASAAATAAAAAACDDAVPDGPVRRHDAPVLRGPARHAAAAHGADDGRHDACGRTAAAWRRVPPAPAATATAADAVHVQLRPCPCPSSPSCCTTTSTQQQQHVNERTD